MLTKLSVENYALIEKLDLELTPSLNIITGETGAGKSILLGALGLILGNRADVAVLKDHSKNCIVEGSFDIARYRLQPFFEENDIDYDDTVIIRRVITPAGKSRAYVNDLPVQLNTLRDLANHLIDIHSQHQSLMLSDEEFRIEVLDRIINRPSLSETYRSAFQALEETERRLSLLKEETERNRKEEEFIRYQYDQLAAAKLHAGELADLEQEQRELANATQIQETLGGVVRQFDEDDAGILPRLKEILHDLRHIGDVYAGSRELAERIDNTYVELKEIDRELTAEAGRIEADPGRLAAVEGRLDTIYSLLQKHRVDNVEALIELEKSLADKLHLITGSDSEIAELENEIAAKRIAAEKVAAELTSERKKAGDNLAAGIGDILKKLGMGECRFSCQIERLPELSASGADRIRFLFASTPEASPQSIDKIASGGELSRVMLGLKAIVAKSSLLPTIVFDEIDTGVSGRIADAMGEIIASLAESMQVVNITHLPQVASKGKNHLLVYKENVNGKIQTCIRRLTPDERIAEIAKMLSGSSVTDAARTQAESLLGLR